MVFLNFIHADNVSKNMIQQFIYRVNIISRNTKMYNRSVYIFLKKTKSI